MLRPEDYQLSMRVSARAKDDRPDLRTLLIHRLRPAPKAILRLSNSRDLATADMDRYGAYCEPCREWTRRPDWADDWECPLCGTLYRIEFAVFSAV
jgi:hypothetical protein